MKMELIQPFINSADAVLARACNPPWPSATSAWKRKPIAGKVSRPWSRHRRYRGPHHLRPRPRNRRACASNFAGTDLPESDDLVRETACELANQIIGNAITALNDQGFHFRVHPPGLHTAEGLQSSEDTEALVICFETPGQCVHEYRAALQHPVVRRPGGCCHEVEHRTPDLRPRTSDFRPQTSRPQTSDLRPQTSDRPLVHRVIKNAQIKFHLRIHHNVG